MKKRKNIEESDEISTAGC